MSSTLCTSKEIKKSVGYRLINSAKVIQWTWRAFKLGPETWAKRVWNMVRNDGFPDRKKYLGILSTRERKINPQTREEYALFIDEHVNNYKRAFSENLAQKYIKEFNHAVKKTTKKEMREIEEKIFTVLELTKTFSSDFLLKELAKRVKVGKIN